MVSTEMASAIPICRQSILEFYTIHENRMWSMVKDDVFSQDRDSFVDKIDCDYLHLFIYSETV